MAEVPVPVERLLPGTVLRASDVRLARLPASRIPTSAAHSLEDVLGKQIRYQAAPGTPLALSALAQPVLVQRNGRVLIEVERPGLALSVEGRALEAGAMGEHVRVVNPASRAVLDGEIVGEGRVRVDPNAPPLSAPRAYGAPESPR
jgi:flagella basal body P-ring formation protein FlgA